MSENSLDVFAIDSAMSLETKSKLAMMESLTQTGSSTMVGTFLREQRQHGNNPRPHTTAVDQPSFHHSEWTGTSVTYTPSVTADNGAHFAVHHEEYYSTVEFPLDLGMEGNQSHKSKQEPQEAVKEELCTGKKKIVESLPTCTKTFNKPASIPSDKSTRSRSSSASAAAQVCAAMVNLISSAASSPVHVYAASTLSQPIECSSPLTQSVEPLKSQPAKCIKTQKLMINRSKLMEFMDKYNHPNEFFKIGPNKTKLPLGCRKNPSLRLSLCRSECRSDGALTLAINVYFPGGCNPLVKSSIIQVKLTLVNPQSSKTINSESVSFALEDRTVTVDKFFPYTPLINSNCVAFELRMEVFLCDFFPDSLCQSNTEVEESKFSDSYDMITIVTKEN